MTEGGTKPERGSAASLASLPAPALAGKGFDDEEGAWRRLEWARRRRLQGDLEGAAAAARAAAAACPGRGPRAERLRAAALLAEAEALLLGGRRRGTRQRLDAAAAAAARCGLEHRVLHLQGLAAQGADHPEEARALLQRAADRAHRAGDFQAAAAAREDLARLFLEAGEAGRAEAQLQRALAARRAGADRAGEAETLHLLGEVALQLERLPRAQHHFEEAIALLRTLGETARVVHTMGLVAQSLLGQGKLDAADRRLKMALTLARRLRDPAVEGELLRTLAEVARRRGRVSEARRRLENARRAYRDGGQEEGLARVACEEAALRLEMGDPKGALRTLAGALRVLRRVGRPAWLVAALLLRAQAQRQLEDREGALATLTEAAALARRNGLYRELELLEGDRQRLVQPQGDTDENSIRFFREFCLFGLRGTVKQYRVLREVGRGSTGIVYEAEDPVLGRSVAVKMLKPELSRSSQLVARFRHELEAVGLVDHPNVMKIYACGRNDDRFFYVTDFLPGPSLRDLLQERGPLSVCQALRLAGQVADALAAVHRAGVVHRDLKPGNVLLDGRGRPVVVDFGVAGKQSRHPPGEDGAILGTYLYMPLEQLCGRRKPEPAWDVFALGVTLYELLTGRLPFPARSLPELLERLEKGRAAPLRANGVERRVRRLLRAMLARDPGSRPAAAEVAAELGTGR